MRLRKYDHSERGCWTTSLVYFHPVGQTGVLMCKRKVYNVVVLATMDTARKWENGPSKSNVMKWNCFLSPYGGIIGRNISNVGSGNQSFILVSDVKDS